MAALATAFMSIFSSGSAAAGASTAAAATTAAGASTFGSTIASILQGTATALSVFSTVGAANTEAASIDLAASDAERQKSLETLQGVERRTSIKKSLMSAIGAENTAYGASGVDLTFGTPNQARKDAFREADLGIETATGAELTNASRLDERAANYRSRARSTRSAGVLEGVTKGIGGLTDILKRG